jgi:hypothetical protein
VNKHYPWFLIIFLSAGLHNLLFAQQYTDSLQLRKITANVDVDFKKAIGSQSRLYNGPSYELITTNSYDIGNAYFKDTTALFNGSVIYDGIQYTNVPLLYDTYQDLLVSRMYNSAFLYSLLSELVVEFDLPDHHFIRISPGNASKLVTSGFYEELYRGKLVLLAKHTKAIQKGTRGYGVLQVTYYAKHNYYLKKGGQYVEVNSKGAFLDVLKDKKKELKKYLKDNNINFGDNPEQAMTVLANYYDKITN